MKAPALTCRRTLNTLLLAATLAALVGCGKKEDTDPQAIAQKQAELALAAPKPLTPEEQKEKAFEAYDYLLDNQDYIQQAGDVRNALSLAGMTDLRKLLATPPTRDKDDIFRKMTQKAKGEIIAEQDIILPDDIRHVVREKYPRIKLGDRVRLPSIKGRMVSGPVVRITLDYIQVSSVKLIRDDLPFEYRARIWPEENAQLVERTSRAQASRTHWAMNKFLQPKLAREVPPQLIKAGYLPNPRNPQATLTSTNAEHWIPGNRILGLIGNEIRIAQEAKIEDYWTKLGYVKGEGPNGTVWVPAPPKKTK